MRVGPRRRAAGVRADDAGAEPGRDLGQARVGAGPGVVDQVGAGLAGGDGDRRPPGVDADHQVREACPHPRDERHHPADLLGDVDLAADPGLHAADVDDVGAFVDGAVDRVHGRLLVEGGAGVEERIRRAVDDGHHRGPVGRQRSPAQDDAAGRPGAASSASLQTCRPRPATDAGRGPALPALTGRRGATRRCAVAAASVARSRRRPAGRPARRWCRSGRSGTRPAPGQRQAAQFGDRQPVAGQLHAQRRPSRGGGGRPVFQSTTVRPPSRIGEDRIDPAADAQAGDPGGERHLDLGRHPVGPGGVQELSRAARRTRRRHRPTASPAPGQVPNVQQRLAAEEPLEPLVKGGAPAQLWRRFERAPAGAAGGPAACGSSANSTRAETDSVPGSSTSTRAAVQGGPLGQQGGHVGRPAERIRRLARPVPVGQLDAGPASRSVAVRRCSASLLAVECRHGAAATPPDRQVAVPAITRSREHRSAPARQPARAPSGSTGQSARPRAARSAGSIRPDPGGGAHSSGSATRLRPESAHSSRNSLGPAGFAVWRPSGGRRTAAPARPWSARRRAAAVPRSAVAARTPPRARPGRRRRPSGCRPAAATAAAVRPGHRGCRGGSWAGIPEPGAAPGDREDPFGEVRHGDDLPLQALGRVHGQHLDPAGGGRHLAGRQAVLPFGGRVQVVQQLRRPGPGRRDLGDDIGERIQVRPTRPANRAAPRCRARWPVPGRRSGRAAADPSAT